jgi:hypothetical protein
MKRATREAGAFPYEPTPTGSRAPQPGTSASLRKPDRLSPTDPQVKMGRVNEPTERKSMTRDAEPT